jgi:hypothetical protein
MKPFLLAAALIVAGISTAQAQVNPDVLKVTPKKSVPVEAICTRFICKAKYSLQGLAREITCPAPVNRVAAGCWCPDLQGRKKPGSVVCLHKG